MKNRISTYYPQARPQGRPRSRAQRRTPSHQGQRAPFSDPLRGLGLAGGSVLISATKASCSWKDAYSVRVFCKVRMTSNHQHTTLPTRSGGLREGRYKTLQNNETHEHCEIRTRNFVQHFFFTKGGPGNPLYIHSARLPRVTTSNAETLRA